MELQGLVWATIRAHVVWSRTSKGFGSLATALTVLSWVQGLLGGEPSAVMGDLCGAWCRAESRSLHEMGGEVRAGAAHRRVDGQEGTVTTCCVGDVMEGPRWWWLNALNFWRTCQAVGGYSPTDACTVYWGEGGKAEGGAALGPVRAVTRHGGGQGELVWICTSRCDGCLRLPLASAVRCRPEPCCMRYMPAAHRPPPCRPSSTPAAAWRRATRTSPGASPRP